MTMWLRAVAIAACCGMVATACNEQPAASDATRDVEPHAIASVEPSEIRIGDRAVLEIVVVTPAGWQLLPFPTPESLTGFEVLAIDALAVKRGPQGWLHRTRVRLRAREIGSFVWPRTTLELKGVNGVTAALSLAPVPLAVRSILPDHPGREEPFGARAAPELADEPQRMAAFAGIGAALALLGLGAVLVRRRRTRSPFDLAPAGEPAWTEALGALGRSACTAEPADAAHAMAAVLRRYMAQRFGAVVEALTTEEIAVAMPPFAATSRWPCFVSLLLDLDALRFRSRRPGTPRALDAARLETLQDRARAFVEDSTPPERLR